MSEHKADELDAALARLSTVGRMDAHIGSCADPLTLFQLAAGALPHDKAEPLTAHVASCWECAAVLREGAELMNESDEEVGASDPLPPAALPAFLVKSAPIPGDKPKRSMWNGRRLGVWFAAAAATAALVYYALPIYSLRRAEHLLAQAESISRPSAFRLSRTSYAPYVSFRGVSSDSVADLVVDAKEVLQNAGNSPSASALRARVEITEQQPEIAIRRLEGLVAQPNPSIEHLNDLGVALMEKGQADRDIAIQRRALSLFDRALRLDPTYRPALWNKALGLLLLGDESDACDAARRFLEVENDARWKVEASSRIVCSR